MLWLAYLTVAVLVYAFGVWAYISNGDFGWRGDDWGARVAWLLFVAPIVSVLWPAVAVVYLALVLWRKRRGFG
jgi:hypothetical protein